MTNTIQLPPTVLESAIKRDPYLKSHHTKRQYKSDLLGFNAWRDGRPLTKQLVESYASTLQADGLAPRTINQHLSAIRWLARWIIDFAYEFAPDPETAKRAIEQAARVIKVRNVKGTRPPRGRHLTRKEIQKLLDACDDSPAGIRDHAMFTLAKSTGLRRDEISKIKLADIIETPEGYDLRVQHGKGDKWRDVPLTNKAMKQIERWLSVRGEEPGYLFCRIYKNGNLPRRFSTPLSGQALADILSTRGKLAGVDVDGWHNFRRTTAGNLWAAGVDGSTIQEFLGHANQNQTKLYDRRPKARMREAAERIE